VRGSQAPARSRLRLGVGIAAVIGYIATVYAANWAVGHWGVVPVGFGFVAPAAVYFIGVAFTLRDITQNILGRSASVAAIAVGALLSWSLTLGSSPPPGVTPGRLALASGIAFLCSEIADLAVYTPLLRRGWLLALVPANAVGLLVDSLLFLTLAFGSLAFLPGQVVGKAWMTLLAVVLLFPVRRLYVIRPEPRRAASAGAVPAAA
jgi:uncharacterized PurR-regulated membrane protein YhhQ (DUF165 family)